MSTDNPFTAPKTESTETVDPDQPWNCPQCHEHIDPNDAKALRKLLWWNKCIHCNKKAFVRPTRMFIILGLTCYLPLLVLNYLTFASGMQIFGEVPSGIYGISNSVLIFVVLFTSIHNRKQRYLRSGFAN